MGTIVVSCEDCVVRHTERCEDCLVTFICGREPNDALIIDAGEARAVRLLARAGLVPSLKHVLETG